MINVRSLRRPLRVNPSLEKPPTAHLSRVVIEENSEELQIVGHGFPYGTTIQASLFFIAYTPDLKISFRLLDRMFGEVGNRRRDHLESYTRAISRATFLPRHARHYEPWHADEGL